MRQGPGSLRGRVLVISAVVAIAAPLLAFGVREVARDKYEDGHPVGPDLSFLACPGSEWAMDADVLDRTRPAEGRTVHEAMTKFVAWAQVELDFFHAPAGIRFERSADNGADIEERESSALLVGDEAILDGIRLDHHRFSNANLSRDRFTGGWRVHAYRQCAPLDARRQQGNQGGGLDPQATTEGYLDPAKKFPCPTGLVVMGFGAPADSPDRLAPLRLGQNAEEARDLFLAAGRSTRPWFFEPPAGAPFERVSVQPSTSAAGKAEANRQAWFLARGINDLPFALLTVDRQGDGPAPWGAIGYRQCVQPRVPGFAELHARPAPGSGSVTERKG